MVLEAAGGLAGGEVPEAEGLVPRPGEGEVAVGGEHHVGDEVAVPVQPLLRDAVLGLIPGELPDDERLVPGGREDHLGELGVGGDLRGTGLSRDRGFISESQFMFDIY